MTWLRRHRLWLACGALVLAGGLGWWRHPRPGDVVRWNHLAEARLQEFGTTGRLTALAEAEAAVRRSRAQEPRVEKNPGGLAMQARVEISRHRFQAARQSAEQLVRWRPGLALGHQLLGDVLLQQGDLAGADAAWAEMRAAGEPLPGCLWREAELALARGHNREALEQLARAARIAAAAAGAAPAGVAWYEVQWGEWAFRIGDWETAEAQYGSALRRWPDFYPAQEHLAELRGAQKKVEEAVRLYEALIARTQRPELMQALGDLFVYEGRAAEAERWHRQALAAYRAAMAEGGEASFAHHLAGFFADAQCVPEQAIRYARRDLQERSGSAAHDALAWALSKAGRSSEAKAESALALASGIEDAHILYHAGLIHLDAGDVAEGRALLRRGAIANPRFNAFHVHR